MVSSCSRLSRGLQNQSNFLVTRAQWGSEVTFSNGMVVESEVAADNLQRLLVDIGPSVADYLVPGQFIQAKVSNELKPGFFAIASPPDVKNNKIELLIKRQGETAEALASATAGTAIQVSSVMGKGFKLDKIPPTSFPNIYIFATGSGISPIKALIESGLLDSRARESVTLYYGVRSPAAMAYANRLSNWSDDHGVRVVPVYSQLGQGYVQDVFAKQGGVGEKGSSSAAVLCGQKGMTEAVIAALTGAGVQKEHILMNF